MKRIMNYLIVGLILSLLLSSCNKDTADPGIESDEDIVSQLSFSEDEDLLFDLGIDDGSDEGTYGSFGKTSALVDTVIGFGRHITEHGIRRLDIRRIARDTIKVFIARQFFGQFVVLGKNFGDPEPTRFHKRLSHIARRNLIFVKDENRTDVLNSRGWGLNAVSLGQGNSLPTATIDILEITVTSSNGANVTYTDPLHTYLDVHEDILQFTHGEEVTVRVILTNSTPNPVDILGNGSTETVLLHYGTNRHNHARKFFEYVGPDPVTGGNIYEGTWTIGEEFGRKYLAIVDAIDNGTIYDDDAETYPYNSTTWAAPYKVVPSD